MGLRVCVDIFGEEKSPFSCQDMNPRTQNLKNIFFRVWHWTEDHMCIRLCGAVWCGHREQCGNIRITILWRGKCRHLLKLSFLMLFSTWNDITSSRLVMLFSWVGALPFTFTYPVAAEGTSSNKKLLLDICNSNVFQEVLIFGAYPAYLDFIKHNITKTDLVFKTYFKKWKCIISKIKSKS